MKNCNDKKKFKTAEASTKSQLRTKGIIDEFLNIIKQNEFRKTNKDLTDYAKNQYGVDKGMLFSERTVRNASTEYYQAVPNKTAFRAIDAAKGINYQLNTVNASRSSEATLAVMKDAGKQMAMLRSMT